MSYIPRLDLAPRRTKPLSLLNPLDYIQLLIWIFFFPQAVTWYVKNFIYPAGQNQLGGENPRQTRRRNRIRKYFAVQALVTLTVTPSVLIWVQSGFQFNALHYIVGVCVLYGASEVAKGMRLREDSGGRMAHGVVYGVVLGVVSALLLAGLGGRVAISLFIVGLDFSGVVRRCLLAGLVFAASLSFSRALARATAAGAERATMAHLMDTATGALVSGLAFGAVLGLGWGVEYGAATSLLEGMKGGWPLDAGTMALSAVGDGLPIGLVAGSAAFLSASRILDWGFSLPIHRWSGGRRPGSRLAWLPLPGARRQLEGWLRQDWPQGLRNLRQILTFTHQLIPAVAAVNSTLASTPSRLLVSRVSALAQGHDDWDLLYFGSVSLEDHLRQEVLHGFFLLPRRWARGRRPSFPAPLRTDTPARAACAGFWAWHRGDPRRALRGFERIQDLPQGGPLHDFAEAVVRGLGVSTLRDLAAWKHGVLESEKFPEPTFRPGARAALGRLREVSDRVARALEARSSRDRSLALGQANAMLTGLRDTVAETCCYPECSLIEKIADRWQEKVSLAGGGLGEEMMPRDPSSR